MGRYRSLQSIMLAEALKGITDNQTITAYKKDCKLFAAYCKEQGVKRPDQLQGKEKELLQGYEKQLEASGYSPATIHRRLAAPCSGVFRVDEKGIMIKTLIRHCIVEEVQTAPRIKRVYELLITDYRIQREPDEINLYPKHWINFLNGMLDVKTGEMHSHSPEYKAISQIPHNYIPGLNLENTIFYEFLQSRIPDRDNQKMLFEFLGICSC